MSATLIALAMQLIVAANKPNVPANLRTQALETAQIALLYAENNSITPTPIPAATAPIEPETTSNPYCHVSKIGVSIPRYFDNETQQWNSCSLGG